MAVSFRFWLISLGITVSSMIVSSWDHSVASIPASEDILQYAFLLPVKWLHIPQKYDVIFSVFVTTMPWYTWIAEY